VIAIDIKKLSYFAQSNFNTKVCLSSIAGGTGSGKKQQFIK
jgi:hypothetical protein